MYSLHHLFLIPAIFFSSFLVAQSVKVSGKVLNQKNEALAGVSIKIAGGGGTSTDVEGRYSLTLSTEKKYLLAFSIIGYATKEIEIEPQAGQTNELNIAMEVLAVTDAGVTITAKARSAAKLESISAGISFQRNTNTVAAVITAESIRRSPDRQAGEVIKRTPGASIQEGKFIVIRGLADRYNQAMLNGVLLTSTEPDRKTFSFDLIPSAMIDNIIINKAFVPEYPGEWAGGLIQVNTKDIPSKNFFNIQLGTGVNTQTIGNDFYKDQQSSTDWLGFDDGSRSLPVAYTRKAAFDTLSFASKTAIGKQMRNAWAPINTRAPINFSVQANGGFAGKLFGKSMGGALAVTYNRANRFLKLLNRSNSLAGNTFSVNYDYNDNRYVKEVTAGAMGSFSVQLNSLNKISIKSLLNINAPSTVTNRTGIEYNRDEDLKGTELTFKQNTFFTIQLAGDHGISKQLKFKWYGAFNILDGYVPDQRRITYTRARNTTQPFTLLLSNSLSQSSGSRIYQSLSDYIYTAGADISYSYNLFKQKQTIKAGYMLQVKDRLYDAQLFANYLPTDNSSLRLLPANEVFAAQNFGTGTDNKIAFDAIKGRTFRYMANTILNGGFLQFDNQLAKSVRVVWGLRVEHFDQLVGSVKKWDPRHSYSKVTDLLPGFNATIKLNNKTNLRFSGSQTVIRPELRELSFLNLYDFELNASVQGNPLLKRTKITNLDLRYEFYPKAGELMTAGFFYKKFQNPIEQLFNEGIGGASTFSYQNAATANAYGVEIELRKKLDFLTALRHFTFQANASYIKSTVTDNRFNINRPMQGQS
ncbi:MAG: hypothetical protein RL115_560, partial [Bacteroidota bacterium]